MSCCNCGNNDIPENYYARPNQFCDCGCGMGPMNEPPFMPCPGPGPKPPCPCGMPVGCGCNLKGVARQLMNKRVIITMGGGKMCVIIMCVGENYIKTINPRTQKFVYFNIDHIDNIVDAMPRCC